MIVSEQSSTRGPERGGTLAAPRPVFAVVYTSTTSEPLSPSDLHELVEQCRVRNQADGITGVLLYRAGNFLQLLEGEEDTVRRLYRKIIKDRRHTGVATGWMSHRAARRFSTWTMAFRDLEENPVVQPAFRELLVDLSETTPLLENEAYVEDLLRALRIS